MMFLDNLITAVLLATVIVALRLSLRKDKLIKASKEYLDLDGESALEPLPDEVLARMEYKKANLAFRAERLAARLSRQGLVAEAKVLNESPRFLAFFVAVAYTKKCDLGPSGRALRKHVRAVNGAGWASSASAPDIDAWCKDVRAWMDAVRLLGVPAIKKKAAEVAPR